MGLVQLDQVLRLTAGTEEDMAEPFGGADGQAGDDEARGWEPGLRLVGGLGIAADRVGVVDGAPGGDCQEFRVRAGG